MTNELTTQKQNAIEALAARLQVSKEVLQSTLKNTVFKGCNNEDFVALVIVANTYKLNPILKELYAFPAKGGGIVPIVSIDGWIKLATNHPDYNGVEQIENEDKDGKVKSITTKFYRKGVQYPTTVTERMDECRRDTEPWKKWPVRMLSHKSYIQGARKAFGFSGIYDEDEAERIVEATEVPAKEPEMPRAKPATGIAQPAARVVKTGCFDEKGPGEAPVVGAAEALGSVPEKEEEKADGGQAVASKTQVDGLKRMFRLSGLTDPEQVEIYEQNGVTDLDRPTTEQVEACMRDISAAIDSKQKAAVQTAFPKAKPIKQRADIA